RVEGDHRARRRAPADDRLVQVSSCRRGRLIRASPPERDEGMLRRFVVLFGAQLSAGAALFANSILMAAWLGPEGRGELALVVLVPTVLLILLNLGAHLGAARMLARREKGFSELAPALVAIACAVSAATFGLAIIFRGAVASLVYRGLEVPVVVLSLASLPCLL